MRFTSLITVALTFAGLVQALPIETRAISSLNGVTFTARNSDGSCQSAQQIAASVKLMKSSGINNIRTYSQECGQLPAILNAINANGGGMTVLAAVWIDGTSNDDSEIATLKSNLAKISNVGAIHGILVGNEVIFNGIMSSGNLIQKINAVKSFAKGIPVGCVEVDSTYSHDLVAASDIVSANIHPFFAGVPINQAYSNLNTRYAAFKKLAAGKITYITETGWPSNSPNIAATQTYASELATSNLPYYFFEWQDADWKSSGAESKFGLLDGNGQTKFAI